VRPSADRSVIMQRLELGSGGANPLGKRRALDPDAVTCQDLRLPVERYMIGVLAHHRVGNQRLRRQPALDQSRGHRRLNEQYLRALCRQHQEQQTRDCAAKRLTGAKELTAFVLSAPRRSSTSPPSAGVGTFPLVRQALGYTASRESMFY
jgi:hypothetical protein